MRSIAMRLGVGMVLGVLALGAPTFAAAHRAAPPRCPRARPQDGQHCPRVGMSCGFRGTHEGARDAECTCALDPNDHLVWTCQASGPVYSD
jgi:hypothetical protein